MKFADIAAQLGQHNQEQAIYSVEDRNMLDHETAIQYFAAEEEAIAAAEELWQQFDDTMRDEHEVSVHGGALVYQDDGQPRFIVHQKLFKAYKKIYVAQQWGRQFIDERQACYQQRQALPEKAALAQARRDFAQDYAIQPPAAYGMFAGYSYHPHDEHEPHHA